MSNHHAVHSESHSSPERRAPERDPRPTLNALVSGTSNEFLGNRPLPRVLRDRPLVVITGPEGVGKSAVARRLAGKEARCLAAMDLHRALVRRVRRSSWDEHILSDPDLILDGPVFLRCRPAAATTVQELLQLRRARGLRTVVCEGELSDGSISLLMDAVPPETRVTLMLRFPVGRGRIRFARSVCRELGISTHHETLADDLEPWTYSRVKTILRRVKDGGGL